MCQIIFREVLQNGKALRKFQEMIVFQGVEERDADTLCNDDVWKILKRSPHKTTLSVSSSGSVENIDALTIGRVCQAKLGAGRSGNESYIDTTVGIELIKTVGDEVKVNDPWVIIYHKGPILEESIINEVKSALHITQKKLPKKLSKIVKVLN